MVKFRVQLTPCLLSTCILTIASEVSTNYLWIFIITVYLLMNALIAVLVTWGILQNSNHLPPKRKSQGRDDWMVKSHYPCPQDMVNGIHNFIIFICQTHSFSACLNSKWLVPVKSYLHVIRARTDFPIGHANTVWTMLCRNMKSLNINDSLQSAKRVKV